MTQVVPPELLIAYITFVLYVCLVAYAVFQAKHVLFVLRIFVSLMALLAVIFIFENLILQVSIIRILKGENWGIWIIYGSLVGVVLGGMMRALINLIK